jgi:SAM-dependent methyltransferase
MALWAHLSAIGKKFRIRSVLTKKTNYATIESNVQDLNMYWDPQFAQVLETWGIGNVWDEIQFLMVNRTGKVLDVACGTGKTMELLSKYPDLQVYGCDISDFLIQKAIDRGISSDQIVICDATKMDYADNFFNHSYSIGSLEHFTEEGIIQVISECHRITRFMSCHQVPVSRSGKNEGWTKTIQSFHNNSSEWWIEKFMHSYQRVFVLDSKWQDDISIGKWFVCVREWIQEELVG